MRKTPLSAFVDEDSPVDRASKRREARKSEKLAGNPHGVSAARQRHRALRRARKAKERPA
jgi:hypothetical protein